MKNDKLLDVLGKVNEAFIEEAAPQNAVEQTHQEVDEYAKQGQWGKKSKTSRGWAKWVAMAACAVLVLGIAVPKIYGAIHDDTRSFWPEKEDYAFALTEEMVDALTMDTAIDFSSKDEGFLDWGLTLSVKDVTPVGLTLVCSRRGGNPTGELECGTDYHLKVLEDGTWKDVPTVIEEYAWNSLAYWIWEGQDTEFTYSWEWLYGKLPAGTYRLTKGFMDFRGTGDYDTAVYWVEFEITE